LQIAKINIKQIMHGAHVATYRPFATTVSQLKMCDISGETFRVFEVL
jgi:hypothetical protein